jgi:hypothetical protein
MLRTWTDDATYRHPITALEIDAPNATVEVGPGAAGQVKIHSRLTWVSTKPRVRLTWDRDILRIAVTCDRAALFDSRECGAGLDLRVPAATAMRVDATATSGTVGINLPPGEQYAVIGASGSGPRNIAPELVDGRSHREINVTTGSGPVHVGYSFPS